MVNKVIIISQKDYDVIKSCLTAAVYNLNAETHEERRDDTRELVLKALDLLS